ncbi:MAG: LppX_LprAFG lipoprotein, partial [Anaerolineae bacterium]|nr:LppX_LprAFG lipoprotein [Anaerolineae bacterium]
YPVSTDFGADVFFRQAKAQYVAPDTMQGSVRLVVAGIPADVDIFARGDVQWYRNAILTANRWFNQPFAPGFNPKTLIADDTGFQAALNSVIDLSYNGEASLEDSTPVYHLRGTADGADIAALLAGMIAVEGNAEVDVFIHREQRIPVRFIIRLPQTVTEAEPEPTTWTVDVYDINAEPELDEPDLVATAEATSEAGS